MAATAGLATSSTQRAKPIQKEPKVPHALPVAWVIQPAFLADSRTVVRAKAASPSGAGSAMLETGAGTVAGWTVRSSLTLKSIPPSTERLVRLPACRGGSREGGCPALIAWLA